MPSLTRRALLASIPAALAASPNPISKGICSTAFPPSMPLETCFEQAANAGFDAFEIGLGDQIGPDTPVDVLRRLADRARRAKIRIDSVWVSSRILPLGLLNSERAEVREAAVGVMRRAVSAAAALGSPCVLLNVVRVGSDARFMVGYRDTWDRFTAGIRQVLADAAGQKITLTPENVHNRFLLSPLEAAAFVDQFHSDWVGFHFDIGNVMISGYPQDWIRTLGRRIRRLHAKDVKLHRGGFEFVDLLDGDVDWPAVMSALRSVGFRGSLTCESDYKAGDADALRRIAAKLDKIIGMG